MARSSVVPVLALLVPFLAAGCSSGLEAIDRELAAVADEVARLATAQRVERLAVVDLATADDRSTDLGRYLADALSGKLGNRADTLAFALCSRDQIGDLLAELKLDQSGLIDPQQAAEVGRMCGAEVVVVGRYWLIGPRLEAKFDLLRTETAVQIGSAELAAPLSAELRGMDVEAKPRRTPTKRRAASDRKLPETRLCDPFSLTLTQCRFEGDDLFCRFVLRNEATGRRSAEIGGGSLLIDNGRDEYHPSRVTIGTRHLDLVAGDDVLAYELPANTSLNAQLDFHTIGRQEKKAQVLVVDLGGCKAEFRDFFFSRD